MNKIVSKDIFKLTNFFFWTLYSKILEGGKRYHFFVINIKQHNIFNIDLQVLNLGPGCQESTFIILFP